MVKTVGNYVLWCALFMCNTVCARELTLQMTDLAGASLDKVQAGVPFKIKVSAQGASVQQHDIKVDGMEQLLLEGHETHLRVINGDRTVSHVYRVRIDRPGTYLVGPAWVDTQGTRVESEVLTCQVVRPDQAAAARTATKETSFARLTVDKERVFVGEKFRCSLRFYTKSPEVQGVHILVPSHSIIQPNKYEGPVQGTEVIRGVSHSYAQWQWVCTPTRTGELVIPACSVIYTMPSDEPDRFGGFSVFFGVRPKQYTVYTNPVSITVEDLPPYDGHVNAVGAFKSFALSLEPSKAEVGQGIVLRLTLKGAGDLDAITTPELCGMPAELKYYPSQETVADDQQQKTFEYIIQGTQPGTWEIPPQTFTFFDTATARYKLLTTKAKKLTLTAPAVVANPVVPVASSSVPTSELSAPSDHDQLPLVENEAWNANYYRTLPLWLLVTLFMVPVCAAGAVFAKDSVESRYGTYANKKKYVRAFKHAKEHLHAAEQKRAYSQLYPIFMELLATRLGTEQRMLTDDTIADALKRAGVPDAQVYQWREFFAQCASFVFSGHGYQDPALFKQAHYWLGVVEGAL